MSTEDIRVESSSKERVAFDLMSYIVSNGHPINDKEDILDLYAECLIATMDRRVIPKQK